MADEEAAASSAGASGRRAEPASAAVESAVEADDSKDTGVKIVTLHPGDATNYPKDGSTVRCHYETLIEGEGIKIDSSRDRKAPLEFRVGLGQVIAGLDVAMKKLSRGQRAKITIPPELAYGARGYPPIIPPGASLVMDVELISFA